MQTYSFKHAYSCLNPKVGRLVKRRFRPWILTWLPDTKWTWKQQGQMEGSSITYDVITGLVTYFLVNYTALAFVILSFNDSIKAWS